MNTIFNSLESEKSLISEFIYQEKLTTKLDKINIDFTQETLNEIVLWKVNRYAEFETSTLSLLNEIKKSDTEIKAELTKNILRKLLNTKGVRIAMASTILRFKNPKIYQIIDQRVFRYISENGEELNEGTKIENQIEIYLDYLERLRKICLEHKIQFEESDRILYLMDKKQNKENKLKESRKKPNG
jgi:hypothetical protein